MFVLSLGGRLQTSVITHSPKSGGWVFVTRAKNLVVKMTDYVHCSLRNLENSELTVQARYP